MARVILHIDLNAFFANAELLKHPEYADKPLIVAGLSRRSVVSTANYLAREYGVHSAMPIHQALSLCPELVVLEGDYSWYEELSGKFFKLIKTFTPFVEPASIDECYADVTDIIKHYKRPLDLVWKIQQEVYKQLKLPCSIGVAPNKFLAKMASDMRKPMGITILRKQEIKRKLWPLPISEMQGIGKKSAPLLIANNILTIGDLANPDNETLIRTLLGKHSYNYIQNALGNDTDKLCFNTTLQSLSNSTTLPRDSEDYSQIKSVFAKLSKVLSNRAKNDDVKGKMLSISIRYSDFSNIVRSTTLDYYTNDEKVILETALLLFDKNNTKQMPIRHLGVGLASLYSNTKQITQLKLFQDDPDEFNVLDELNKYVKGSKLIYASQMKKNVDK